MALMEVGWLEFNVRFQHKYGYIKDEIALMEEREKSNILKLSNARRYLLVFLECKKIPRC